MHAAARLQKREEAYPKPFMSYTALNSTPMMPSFDGYPPNWANTHRCVVLHQGPDRTQLEHQHGSHQFQVALTLECCLVIIER